MIGMPRYVSLSFPGRTNWSTTVGSVSSVHCWQYGHWGSSNTSIVAGAAACPTVSPCWGIPANVALGPPAPDASVETLVVADFEDPLDATRISATARTAAPPTAAAIRSIRRDFIAPPGCRTRATAESVVSRN